MQERAHRVYIVYIPCIVHDVFPVDGVQVSEDYFFAYKCTLDPGCNMCPLDIAKAFAVEKQHGAEGSTGGDTPDESNEHRPWAFHRNMDYGGAAVCAFNGVVQGLNEEWAKGQADGTFAKLPAPDVVHWQPLLRSAVEVAVDAAAAEVTAQSYKAAQQAVLDIHEARHGGGDGDGGGMGEMVARLKPVPSRVHQTWKTAEIPIQFATFVQSWRTHNPPSEGWEHAFWSDDDLEALVEREFKWFQPVWRGYPHKIMRIDAARLLLLWKYGGVYADLDFECLKPFARFVGPANTAVLPGSEGDGAGRAACFVGVEPRAHESVYRKFHAFPELISNALIGCAPHHPFFSHPTHGLFPLLLRRAEAVALRHSTTGKVGVGVGAGGEAEAEELQPPTGKEHTILWATGPSLVDQAVRVWNQWCHSKGTPALAVDVHSDRAFFPLANPRWFKNPPNALEGAFAVHHWANSWAQPAAN
jgi:mannosyltransferase OCH1-like enzyme